jgi:hypothetical protein
MLIKIKINKNTTDNIYNFKRYCFAYHVLYEGKEEELNSSD